MENNNDQKNPKDAGEKVAIRFQAVKALKEITNSDSPWTLTQEILQDIHAGHIIANPNVKPVVTQMVDELKKEIEVRYSDNEELKQLLLTSIPAVQNVRVWLKKDGWEEAVWKKVRGDQLFSPEKRAQVIEALRERAMDKSDVAAKIWLTLSGDYSEKMEVSDKTLDAYREINSILHRKKNEE